MNTSIYLIRHGESLGNLNRVCLGHTNLGLTERGREQARLTAEALSAVHFDAIYSSDLCRAMATAAPHAELRGLAVICSAELRELYFGLWENRAVAELEAEWGDRFTLGWRMNFGTFTAPEGESVVAMADRAAAFLVKIAREHPEKTILVASHAALIRALYAKISGHTPDKWAEAFPFPSNASYSVLECDGECLIPVSYSNDGHLAGVMTALPMK